MYKATGRKRTLSDQGDVNRVINIIQNNDFDGFKENLLKLVKGARGSAWHGLVYRTINNHFSTQPALRRQYFQEFIIFNIQFDEDFAQAHIKPLFDSFAFLGKTYKQLLLNYLEEKASSNTAYKDALALHFLDANNNSALRYVLTIPRVSWGINDGQTTVSVSTLIALSLVVWGAGEIGEYSGRYA